jgi:hypothetical protein
MKVATVSTLIFSTLALASPAPAAQPYAAAVAQPLAVAPRDPAPILEARKKPKVGNSGNTTAAAYMLSPSRALQLGALGVGVVQIIRLW